MVLVSRNEAYRVRELAIIVPVTTRARGIPVEVPLGAEEGLPRPSVANADTITTIPRACLVEYAGTLSVEKQRALEGALRFALGME